MFKMKRSTSNRNEKSDRNRNIYQDREDGLMIVDIANKYNLSVPRIHRIHMQEENKVLKEENQRIRSEQEKLRARLNSMHCLDFETTD